MSASTDISERGLEDLIVAALTAGGEPGTGVDDATGLYGSGGWNLGHWRDYEREYAVDLVPQVVPAALHQSHSSMLAHYRGRWKRAVALYPCIGSSLANAAQFPKDSCSF